MATTPKLVGPSDPALAKSFETQTPSVARTSPPTVSATGTATSTGGTISRGIAPKVAGDTTTYNQATQASSGTELFIVSSNNNDSSDIVTVYNTQKDISVSAVNQTFNNYKVTNNNSYGNSNVADFLTSYDGDLSAGNLNVIGATNLGDVSNVHIEGGTNGQVLSTNGSGALVWSNVSSGPGLGNITINGDNVSSTNDIVNIVGNNYAQLESANTYIWVEDGEADIEVNGNRWIFNNQGYMEIPNEGSFGALNSSILAFSSQNNKPIFIEVVDTGSSEARQWIFDNAGNLTLPDGTVIQNGGGIEYPTSPGYEWDLHSSDGNVYIGSVEDMAYIDTYSPNIGVRLRSNENDWIFGPDGNLTLPGNTFAVNYANGTQVPLGGGGANTGNVTFDDINIIGTGNLHLQPDPANAGSYLDIFLTSGPDLHLVASASANLILGKDLGANVMTSWNGNAYVQSWDGNNASIWTFGGDGALTLPNDANIATIGNVTQFNTCTNGFLSLNSYDAGGNNIASLAVNSIDGLVGISTHDTATDSDYQWGFNITGGTIFPTLTVDLHNGGNQTAQTLQFGDANQQAIITGPTPADNNNAQRIIIQGQRGNGTGEGGDVYVWAGDSDTNGGDIKIYAGDADNVSTGTGGYVNLAGGDGFDNGGHINIDGGSSANATGGAVSIAAGYGQIDGGTASLQGGYGADGQGGAVQITGGGSSNGTGSFGNVVLGSGMSGWIRAGRSTLVKT
jgi:hypothetical protein